MFLTPTPSLKGPVGTYCSLRWGGSSDLGPSSKTLAWAHQGSQYGYICVVLLILGVYPKAGDPLSGR